MAKNATIVIKQNTQQLLVWLYGISGENRSVEAECVQALWSQLVPEGRRSLLRYLEKNKYINVTVIGKRKYLSLTSYGREAIEAILPAFNPSRRVWQGNWLIIVITEAANQQGRARKLKQLLAQQGAFSIERQVYLCPAPLTANFREFLSRQWRGAVLIWEAEKLALGDERLLVLQKSELLTVLNLYSGISKDIDRLIELRKSNKYTTNQYIDLVMATYSRFFTIITQDLGLIRFYFKNEPNGLEILSRLQNLAITR